MSYDVSLAEDPARPGRPMAHAVDCPVVRAQAERGEPVMTMLDCESPLPSDIPRHSCLETPASSP